MNLFIKAKTLYRLGFFNVFRVLIYRLSLKLKISRSQHPKSKFIKGNFFSGISKDNHKNISKKIELKFFGAHKFFFTNPPKWNLNYFNNINISLKNWWEIKDQNKDIGDIKLIWELSRFSWILKFIENYLDGQDEYLDICDEWINDWCDKNQPYKGPNWKCGQEASIRLISTLIGMTLLDEIEKKNEQMIAFVLVHLERIIPTISYAISQNNNHGTSEAAALFVGGAYLEFHKIDKGRYYKNKGKTMLEERVSKLIAFKGGFSQYSINYHRFMLETCLFVEIFRRRLSLKEFSERFSKKITIAIGWLHNFIIDENGKAPNTGANDGSNLFTFNNTEYTDYRHVVQLGTALFMNRLAFKDSVDANYLLKIFNISPPKDAVTKKNYFISDDIGFCSSRKKDSFLFFRYPQFSFRPSQSDILHIDFWIKGINVLRDGGSNSYSDDFEHPNTEYFSGVECHNTIQFDGFQQMPRLSRFLFGAWPSPLIKNFYESEENNSFESSYKDHNGNTHRRTINHGNSFLEVEDKISITYKSAILRWRLNPDKWTLSKKDSKCIQISNNASIDIKIESDRGFENYSIEEGFESKYYYSYKKIPVLTLKLKKASKINTFISWKE
tara:strand:+ start:6119 stop:7954 length:1836 start_codon:yes stop_codon:yes gene_type:complete